MCTSCILVQYPESLSRHGYLLFSFQLLETLVHSSFEFYIVFQLPKETHDNKLFNCFKVLEGRSYRLQHPWVGIVNRSQADINKNVDMLAARRKEQEYFESSPEYGHLSHKMGAEYLAKLLSKVSSL